MGLNSRELPTAKARALSRLREETGLEYDELLTKYKALSEEERKLEEDIRKIRKEKEGALRDKQVTVEQLNEYTGLRDFLKEYGLDVKNLRRVKALLKNVEETGGDAENIVKELSETESLAERKKVLEKEVRKLNEDAETLRRLCKGLEGERQELEKARQEASRLRMEIEAVRQLTGLGYDLPTLKSLSMHTKSYGGVKALLENLYRRMGLAELDGQIALKKRELNGLNSEVGKKRVELESLNETIKSRERVKEDLEKSLSTLNGSLMALAESEKDTKLRVSRLDAEKSRLEKEVENLRQRCKDAEAKVVTLTGEIEGLEKHKEELENSIKGLTAEEKALKESVEKRHEEIELSKAIVTLMNAKTPGDIEQLKDFLERTWKWVLEKPSPSAVEAAKKVIIDRLMPSFRTYKCSNCHTRFAVDSPKSLDEYPIALPLSIWCPVCHSLLIDRDYSLAQGADE